MFERVHMVWDLYDGVRTGLADFHGAPHYFKCIFKEDDYTDLFELQPIDPTLFAEAREQWALYRAWELRYHSGEVALATHPGHGGIVARYDELERSLTSRLASIVEVPVVARAEFRAVEVQPVRPDGCLRDLEVLWTPAA